jgi:hypothetical protein
MPHQAGLQKDQSEHFVSDTLSEIAGVVKSYGWQQHPTSYFRPLPQIKQ